MLQQQADFVNGDISTTSISYTKHASTSSSVYSPIQLEFIPSSSAAIQEEDEEDEEDEDFTKENNELDLNRKHSHVTNNSMPKLYYRSNSEGTLSSSNKQMTTDVSNQTLQTYITAHAPSSPTSSTSSTSSYNDHHNTTLRTLYPQQQQQSYVNQYAEPTHLSLSSINLDNRSIDNDETPILNEADRYPDKTPLFNPSDRFVDNTLQINNHQKHSGASLSTSQEEIAEEEPTRLLPQRKLSKKFKRLSMTLQNTNASENSTQFMNNFHQNVTRDREQPSSFATTTTSEEQENLNRRHYNANTNDDDDDENSKVFGLTRTSTYYRKINEKPDQSRSKSQTRSLDGLGQVSPSKDSFKSHEGAETSMLHDHQSELGSLSSSRASTYSEQSSYQSREEVDLASTNSSSNFVFNNGNSYPSSYNIRGTQANDDEVPVRKDLLEGQTPVGERFKTYNNNTNDNIAQQGGLNIFYNDNDNFNTNTSPSRKSLRDKRRSPTPSSLEDEDLSSLFIRALHSFDSSTLQSESDASICLSFKKHDLAFVHSIDESGWGEVTLVNSLERGWIPMNYFTISVSDKDVDEEESGDVNSQINKSNNKINSNSNSKINSNGDKDDDEDDDESDTEQTDLPNSRYLKTLFHACAKFLLNPLSHATRRGKYTFSIRVINSIRDGVRLLLQQTDCLSRSNEIVTKRQIVRKARKSLLADWYNLMVKANEFKGTSNFDKIEILTLMVYQVASKAIAFLEIWSVESKEVLKEHHQQEIENQHREREQHHEHQQRTNDNDLNNFPLLKSPPLAKQRITEINGILYSYLGIIIGRLDLIEHNQVGCEILETLAHQIILLLRELLFISKSGSELSSEKPSDLDGSLDGLLSLVSDLVTGVKNLVVKTINEGEVDIAQHFNLQKEYFYTEEGATLLQVAAKMIKSISTTIYSVRKLLSLTGDFRLNPNRPYPDFFRMRVEPQDFVKRCMKGIKGGINNQNLPGNTITNSSNNNKQNGVQNDALSSPAVSRPYKANRYSMVRSGKTGDLGITESGSSFLQQLEQSPFTVAAAEFEPFTTTTENGNGSLTNGALSGSAVFGTSAKFNASSTATATTNTPSTVAASHPEKDLVLDLHGRLVGGSFKGLVYTLTNEDAPPEHFYISTFFITFRNFVTGIDFIEELITRFEVHKVKVNDINYEIKLRKRRRLIARMFQLWMESYWNHETDYSLLTTLINFYNEGISNFLPLEALKLIEIGAKLSSKPLVENRTRRSKPMKQLVERHIMERSISDSDEIASLNDQFDISRSSSVSSSMKSLEVPITSTSTSASTLLLSSKQLETIENIIMTYRTILGASWCSAKYLEHYKPLNLQNLMPHFAIICDQSWVLSNYRPNLLDFNGLEIAKQLTIIESTIFTAIQPEELLNQNFTNKRAHLKLSPNVRLSLLFTNCLSNYVLESVLQPNLSDKERVNTVKVWLKIAISSLYLRNFNSLAAIIAALQSHLITRVDFIWANLSQKYIDLHQYLASILSMEKNYTTYRSKIRNLLASSSNKQNAPIPIVPYINLFISDITTTTEGIPKYIPSAQNFLGRKVINFQRYSKIVKIIADLQQLQVPYNNGSDTASHALIDSTDVGDVDYEVQNVPALQELILLELWKVNILHKNDEDRGWKLSCAIVNGK